MQAEVHAEMHKVRAQQSHQQQGTKRQRRCLDEGNLQRALAQQLSTSTEGGGASHRAAAVGKAGESDDDIPGLVPLNDSATPAPAAAPAADDGAEESVDGAEESVDAADDGAEESVDRNFGANQLLLGQPGRHLPQAAASGTMTKGEAPISGEARQAGGSLGILVDDLYKSICEK
jgi:hypothetical protein